MKLITHDGSFHADDVFATAILRDLFPDAQLIRTRDPAFTAPADERIVYDVGRVHDPENRMFDHHQVGSPTRADGTPYSSVGLIWQTYGQRWLAEIAKVPETELGRVHLNMDRGFILEIDKADNGVSFPGVSSPLHLSRLIEMMTPDFDDDDPAAMQNAFDRAVAYANLTLRERTRSTSAKFRAERVVSEILETHDGGPVLELPYGMPWESTLRKANADHILFVLIPRPNEWSISGVRKGADAGSFEQRLDLPEEWAGLNGEELEIASGVPGAIFCHKARFYASAKTREAATAMLDQALAPTRLNDAPSP